MLPRIQPVIPARKREPFDAPGWLFDVKYDGFRGLCYLEPGRSRLVSRNGNVLGRFAALAAGIAAEIRVGDAILDGEVIALDETGRPQCYDLLRGARAPAYVAFDLLWLNGIDLRSLPLLERRRRLHAILPRGSPVILPARSNAVIAEAVSVEGRGCELFTLMRVHDLEGIVAKRLDDPYGPRTRWFKIKNPGYSQAEGRGDLFNRASGRFAR